MILAALLEELEQLPGEAADYNVWVYLPPDGEHGTPIPLVARGDQVRSHPDSTGLANVIALTEGDDVIVIPEQRILRIRIEHAG